MKLSTNFSALALVLLTAEDITAFSLLSPCRTSRSNSPATAVYGILDDMMDNSSDNDNSKMIMGQEDKFESLFDDLIFAAGDTKTHIADRLEACSDADFLQWLEWNMEESDDQEEQQALRDLLEMIDQVIVEAAEKEKVEVNNPLEAELTKVEASDTEEEASSPATTASVSTADILKKAKAIMTSEGAGDEPPSDYNFMRDVKAERGLAGFNNKGKMRVGGS